MERLFQIQGINKDEFIRLMERVFDAKMSYHFNSIEPENLSVQKVASLLTVSELTVYNYIKKGIIPAKKIGRKFVIKRQDLEACLKDVKSLKYKRYV